MKKCTQCGLTEDLLLPIYKRGTSAGTEDDYSGKFICEDCLEDSSSYDVCDFCGDEGVYSVKDLEDGCCEEHMDEVPRIYEDSEDDESGWSSLAEYYRDPNH